MWFIRHYKISVGPVVLITNQPMNQIELELGYPYPSPAGVGSFEIVLREKAGNRQILVQSLTEADAKSITRALEHRVLYQPPDEFVSDQHRFDQFQEAFLNKLSVERRRDAAQTMVFDSWVRQVSRFGQVNAMCSGFPIKGITVACLADGHIGFHLNYEVSGGDVTGEFTWAELNPTKAPRRALLDALTYDLPFRADSSLWADAEVVQVDAQLNPSPPIQREPRVLPEYLPPPPARPQWGRDALIIFLAVFVVAFSLLAFTKEAFMQRLGEAGFLAALCALAYLAGRAMAAGGDQDD